MLPVSLLPLGSIKRNRDEYERYLLAANAYVSNRTNLQTKRMRTENGSCDRLQTHVKGTMNIQVSFGGGGTF
jgi:hypothetical protein